MSKKRLVECKVLKGYVTPFSLEGSSVYGALYGDFLDLNVESLRVSHRAAFRHRDPVNLFPHEVQKVDFLNQDFLYLGHSFSHYGHFLLETLPMLTPLVSNGKTFGFFLPWGSQHDLLFSALDLLEIDHSRVYVHREHKIMYSKFIVIGRPLIINKCLLSTSLYYPVINVLKARVLSNLRLSGQEFSRRLFLERKPDRVSIEVYECVADLFVRNGFTRIQPECYSLAEQIEIFASADEIASFPGSQLHSTIFSNSSCRVIEVGDTRSRTKTLENQAMCDQISGVEKVFVSYSDDQNDLLSSICRIL